MTRELIVLAAPASDDPYYAGVADAIFDFHVAFAQQIEGRDDLIVLTDRKSSARYVAALGKSRVRVLPMADIWMRDFTLSNASEPVMFRYTAAGQGAGKRGQHEADAVQDQFAALAESAGLSFGETNLFNDGGNFVDDYAGSIVVSRKFLRDNKLGEDAARAALKRFAGVSHVAFIDSDEQGGLEHADGVVAFVDVNTLVINTYAEDPAYAEKLRADLEAGLPGVVIHEIVTPYDGTRIYDKRFGSACGLYTNALVTPIVSTSRNLVFRKMRSRSARCGPPPGGRSCQSRRKWSATWAAECAACHCSCGELTPSHCSGPTETRVQSIHPSRCPFQVRMAVSRDRNPKRKLA